MGKIVSKIKGLFAKLLVIIAVILIALAIIYSGQTVDVFGMELSGLKLGLLAAVSFGLAYIIDADQATRFSSKISTGASDLVKNVSSVLGTAVKETGNVATTAVSSFLTPVLLIAGGYLLVKSIGESNHDN